MENAVQIEEPGKASGAKLVRVDSLPQLADRDRTPLSYAQQQVWLHAQMVPDIPIYNEPVTIQRQGTLDVAVLERTFSEIIRRHQAWRTTFSLAEGVPVQVVHPPAPVRLPVVDLSSLPASERMPQARRLAEADALRPFDLSRGPLFRALLVRLSDNEHRLFLTLHHIIFDGYSIYRVLLPELSVLYDAFSQEQASPLPDLATQYPDFARWESEWLSRNGHLSSQLAYWKKKLGEGLPVLQLPSDSPRPTIQSFRGAIHPVVLSKDLGNALKLLSQREGATLFMGLEAILAVLLQRYSGVDDVVIGTVSSSRKRSELEGLLGYFLNPVVLRNDLSGDPTFRELLRRTREVALDALSNDDAPFTHVVQAVHPNRSLSFNPLFQALLTLEPPLVATQGGWSATLTQSEVDTGFSKFDLCLELDDRSSGLVGRFKYSTDLFKPDTVARMAGHLETLLHGVLRNPDLQISRLPMLTEPERQQICVDWNRTQAEFPSQKCLHELITSQAERIPDHPALIAGTAGLSYAELDRKSNQLAAYLQKRGVGPEQFVGLYFEPSAEMIVGILGVLKAGGVCVPLDPSYPADRLTYALEDTRLRVLLTQQHLREVVPDREAADRQIADREIEVLCLDSDWSRWADESAEPVRNLAGPENLAYLIYTSGSTGKPKGVQVTHRNLVHSTHARSLYYGAEAGRFFLLSSFAFDSSLVGIFGTLCRGGTLLLTPGAVRANLTGLARLVAENRISELLCVPSLYSLLLDQARPGQLSSLRIAIVAGESCPAELVERHYKLLPHAVLFNEYGPTEAAVWSTVHKCSPGRLGKMVPIGRPIPNAQVYVLDSHLTPLPIGVPGELFIGGPGVVRGYLNQAEETAKRFVPDPFQSDPGARLYRSGDMVRYLADGTLEMLGRFDHQVKIRGFRIELEEIEAVVLECDDVRQAVVVLGGEGTREPKLVAYVVFAGPEKRDTEKLRTFLSRKLPEAMLPTEFVVLDALPLTPNGKVDRAALPAPPESAPAPKFVPSHNPLEARLAGIWESILDRRGIGTTDNFFDLGGHSLLVAKLLLRIEQELGKRLSLANVFQAPTIQQLAALLEEEGQSQHHPAVVPIQPRGSKPPLIWVRGGPLFLTLANRLGSDQPSLGLHLPVAEASRLPVPYKFEDISAALVKCLREVQPEGPYYLGGLCVNAVIAYEMARILRLQGQEVALLVMIDGQNPAYYQDFSQESWASMAVSKLKFHWDKFLKGGSAGIPGFVAGRVTGIGLRLSVLRWRIQHKLGLKVSHKHLQADLDTIVHPSSYLYRPEPYPGHVVFFQSTDWPDCRFFDFYKSWDGLIGGGMEVHRIGAGHLSMFQEGYVDEAASKLQSCLSSASGEAPMAAARGAALVETSKPATPKFREAVFEDYPQIAALESRYGLQAKSREDWMHLWLRNPVYQKLSHWPIGWVCENSDHEIVGAIANIPLAFEFDHQPLIAATSRSLVVDTRYRPYSCSLLSRFFQQKGVDLFVNTTVNDRASKLQEFFRASRVPVGAWDQSDFWITNYRAFVASLLHRNHLPQSAGFRYPLSAGLFLRDTLAGDLLRIFHSGKDVQFCPQFDERFEVFWQKIRQDGPRRLLAVRSCEALQWHFERALAVNKVWVLAVEGDGEIKAYAIFCRQDNPEFGLERMRLIDFQALPGHAELLRPILMRALKRCQHERIHMLEAIGFGFEKRRLIEGFAPHRRELTSWRYFYKVNSEQLAVQLEDPQAWDPTCFDGDSSL